MALWNFQFSKILTVSDITSKPTLPTEIVEHMNPIMKGRHLLDLQVVDARSQEWILRYYTRPNGNRECPVFTTGWRQFVRDKCLQVGDELTFYGHQVRADDGELRMKFMIEVKGPSLVTFNGEALTLDVEYLTRG